MDGGISFALRPPAFRQNNFGLKPMKKLYLPMAAIWMLVLRGCRCSTNSTYHLMLKVMYTHAVPLLTPVQLYQQLQKEKGKPLLFDTRTLAEYNVSHISGAKLMDYQKFSIEQLKEVPKDTPVVLYCSVGYRSERIGEKLQKAGYRNVQHLHGGIFGWVNQGWPVYNKGGKTNQVHAYSRKWGLWLQKGEKVYAC